MDFLRIKRASAEQVFIVVQNQDANNVTMSVGHAVVWDYVTDTTWTTGNNGYAVCFARTTATSAANPAHFAGIVAIKDISPGMFGRIQVYGQCDKVYLTGNSTGFNGATLGQAAWTNATLTNVILRPAGLQGTTNGAATNIGYLGLHKMSTTSTLADADVVAFWHGGYVVPIGQQFSTPGTVGTFTFASSATCKAFIHCLQ